MKKLIALLLASSLVGCIDPSDVPYHPPNFEPVSDTRLPDYWAMPTAEDLSCCIVTDNLKPAGGALQRGDGERGLTALKKSRSGLLQFIVSTPPTLPPDVGSSMGLFSTGREYGTDTNFVVSATFQNPSGSMKGPSWSVGVVARTGQAADLDNLGRLQVTLKAGGNKVELRAQEGADAAKTNRITPDSFRSISPTDPVYNSIYVLHEPFTLKLAVNRKTGTGAATLETTSAAPITIPFTMGIFTKDKGETLTTVGATLANGGPYTTVTVELIDFKIWAN